MKIFWKISQLDVKISYLFPQFYHHKIFNNFMKIITGIGDFGMIWLGLILLSSLHNKTQFLAQKLLIALLLATIICQVMIKTFVKRNRPCQTFHDIKMLVAIPSDYSFPSGHTASSFACATVICYYFPKIGIFFLILALLMGFSRLYLFVHYFSDVCAGMILGILVGIITILI